MDESDLNMLAASLLFKRTGERLLSQGLKHAASLSNNRRRGQAFPDDAFLNNEDPLKDEALSDANLGTGPFLAGGGTSGSSSLGWLLAIPRCIDRGLLQVMLEMGGPVLAAWVVMLALYISSGGTSTPAS